MSAVRRAVAVLVVAVSGIAMSACGCSAVRATATS